MILGIARTTKFALQNITRNWWLSVITVFILVLTTTSITLVAGLNIIGQETIRIVESKVDIDLFFYDYTSEQDILKTKDFVQSLDGVSEVVYVSKDEALQRYKEQHKDDPLIINALDELKENALPASLTIRANAIENYPAIIQQFDESPYSDFVDHTDYSDNQEIISGITRLTQRAYQIGLGVSIIFIIISAIVIFNTIRITIYSHREEVGIMKLVGATNWFVRGPFILESVLLAIISACITLLLFYLLLYFSDPTVRGFFEGYDFSIFDYYLAHLFQFIIAEIGAAVVLSGLSSSIAINKYLKA